MQPPGDSRDTGTCAEVGSGDSPPDPGSDAEYLRAFGRAVRRGRKRLSLSQEALAERAGLHRTYVADIERGRRNPTLKILRKLAGALKTPVGELLPCR